MATAAPASVESAMGRLDLSPGASPMEDDDDREEEREEKGGRKRSEGGERLTRKRRLEEGKVVREEVICEKCGTKRLVSDKELQTEMGRRGCCTMRKTEKLLGARRSGKNPDVGDNWEGAGDKYRVERVPVEQLNRDKRRTAERKAMGKMNR